MVHYAVEDFRNVIEEAKPLLEEHWAEIAVYKDIPLDPDYELYAKASDIGLLRVYTVREDNSNTLVGYAAFFVRPHAHYRGHKWALNDLVWVHPNFRRAHVGMGLVQFWDADLKSIGVDVSHVNVKVAHPALLYLLKNEGYDTVEAGLEKRLN